MRAFSFVLASTVFMLAVGCEAPVDEGFVPPKVGTEIAWKYVTKEGVEDDLVEVVATGPDFAIFKQPSEDEPNGFSYYVEYSGIAFASCDYDLPGYADRKRALSAWPWTVGTEFSFSGDKIIIEKSGDYERGDLKVPVFWLIHDFADADLENDNFAISPKYRMALELKWPEEAYDYVVSVTEKDVKTVEVQEGYNMIEGLNVTQMSECTKLISETRRVTIEE